MNKSCDEIMSFLPIIGADIINACDIGEKIIAIETITLKLCYPYKRFSTNDTIIHRHIVIETYEIGGL